MNQEKHSPLPWRLGSREYDIYSGSVFVASTAGNWPLPKAADERAKADARYIVAASELTAELAEALRELHDFAEVDTHFRYAKRSQAAFDKAAALLGRLGK